MTTKQQPKHWWSKRSSRHAPYQTPLAAQAWAAGYNACVEAWDKETGAALAREQGRD